MTSYSSFDIRIKKIKETIEDIRGDLESLKYVKQCIIKEK
jgi:hypothetical protein